MVEKSFRTLFCLYILDISSAVISIFFKAASIARIYSWRERERERERERRRRSKSVREGGTKRERK